MTPNEIINYLGILGIGSFLGVLVQTVFGGRQNQKKMLFESRIKAYSGLTSRVFNLFHIDIHNTPEPLRIVRINDFFSEAYLLGSSELVELISEYKHKVIKYHEESDAWLKDKKQGDVELAKLHSELVQLSGAIFNQMRNDLFIKKIKFEEEVLK